MCTRLEWTLPTRTPRQMTYEVTIQLQRYEVTIQLQRTYVKEWRKNSHRS
jgi:hypothetical protein